MLSFICRQNKIEPCSFTNSYEKELLYECDNDIISFGSINPIFKTKTIAYNQYRVMFPYNYNWKEEYECFLYLKEGENVQDWMINYIEKTYLSSCQKRKCIDCCKLDLKLNKENICITCENIREFDKHK